MSSKRAPGPIGNWLRSGSNGSLGWPSTATMSVFAPSMPTLVSRAVAALPSLTRTRAPGRALSARGAAAPLAKTRPPLRPAPRAKAGSAKSSLIWPALVDAPVRQHDRDVLIDVEPFGLLDDDRAEQAAALLAGVGRSAMGQIEIEAGIGRREADVGACARREPRPGQAAVAGAGVGRPQAGKAQRGRFGELVDEPQLQLLALLEAEKRARRRAGVGEGRGGIGRRRGKRKARGRRPRTRRKPSAAGAGASARTGPSPRPPRQVRRPETARRVEIMIAPLRDASAARTVAQGLRRPCPLADSCHPWRRNMRRSCASRSALLSRARRSRNRLFPSGLRPSPARGGQRLSRRHRLLFSLAPGRQAGIERARSTRRARRGARRGRGGIGRRAGFRFR